VLRERAASPLRGHGTPVKGAILDKRPHGATSRSSTRTASRKLPAQSWAFYIRNGIVVVEKNANVADGTVI